MNLIDLQSQQHQIKASLKKRINKVLSHGKYIMGPEVHELENELSSFTGSSFCISCANGTDALILSLMSQGVVPGDTILTTPFTFFATAEAISFLRAVPAFIDILPDTLNIDANKITVAIAAIEKKTGSKPKGIITVDLFGLPADYPAINNIAEQENLFVIADAAQSFGASIHKRKVGTLAPVTTTSFFPSKPLGCYGDSGAIFTSNPVIAQKLTSLRAHGAGTDKYKNIFVGMNSRLDTIQAAILLSKLEIFEKELSERTDRANYYIDNMGPLIKTQYQPFGYSSSWASFPIITSARKEILLEFKKNNIPSSIYYPTPLHLQPALQHLGYETGDFPVSESVSKQILNLPIHPYLTRKNQDKILSCIYEGIKNNLSVAIQSPMMLN